MPATRHAALREVLAGTYPTVTFTVRSPDGRLREVAWTDGPPAEQVELLVTTVMGPAVGYALDRTVTAETTAVAYLRAAAAGEPAFRWCLAVADIDAATITATERAAAALTIALAQHDPAWDTHLPHRALAATVTANADVIDAALH